MSCCVVLCCNGRNNSGNDPVDVWERGELRPGVLAWGGGGRAGVQVEKPSDGFSVLREAAPQLREGEVGGWRRG